MDIAKLQLISLTSKVTQELENHLGIRDKVLAEFIIELARNSKDEKDFFRKLEEEEAEFTFALASSLYNLITKMLPRNFIGQKNQGGGGGDSGNGEEVINYTALNAKTFEERVEAEEKHPKMLASKYAYFTLNFILITLFSRFPGLAIPNKANQEELDLDFGFGETKKKEPEPKPQQKPVTSSRDDKKEQHERRRRSPSRSRSRDRDRKHSKKDKKSSHHHKHKKHRSSSRSSSSDRSSRSSSSSSRHRERSSKNDKGYKFADKYEKPRGQMFDEVKVGEVYDGRITKVYDYGCFVQLDNSRRRLEGLVHISNIKEIRISNPYEYVSKGDRVKVKVISVAGSKISLSMKDVDQQTGELIERGGVIKKLYDMEDKEAASNPFKKLAEEPEEMGFGKLTGIKIDDGPPKNEMLKDASSRRGQKRISSPELWELTR